MFFIFFELFLNFVLIFNKIVKMEFHENFFDENIIDFNQENIKKFKNKFRTDVRETIGKDLREAYLRILHRQYNHLIDRYLKNPNKTLMTNESFLSQSMILSRTQYLNRSQSSGLLRKTRTKKKKGNSKYILDYEFLKYSPKKFTYKKDKKFDNKNLEEIRKNNLINEQNKNFNSNSNNFNSNINNPNSILKEKSRSTKEIPFQEEERLTLYEKFLVQKELKQNQIELEKLKKREEEKEFHKPKKYMNEKSKKLIKNTKPIYDRVYEIKHKKLEDLIRIKLQIDDERKYKNFKDKMIFENIKKQNKKNVNSPNFESFNDWYIQNGNWELAKKEKIHNKKVQLEAFSSSKSNEYCSFHPQINKNKYYNKRSNEDFGTRLYNDYFVKKKKMENLIDKYTPKFKPEINQKIKLPKTSEKVYIFEMDEE